MADERLADLGKFLGDQRHRAQDTLRKLTDLTGVTTPGTPDSTPAVAVDLAAAIAHDPDLTDEQRATLTQIYASFRTANAAASAAAAESSRPDEG